MIFRRRIGAAGVLGGSARRGVELAVPLALLGLLVVGCAGRRGEVAGGGGSSAAAPPEVAFGPSASLRMSLRAPARVHYDPQSFGVAGAFVTIRVENTGARRVRIGRLHASFSAVREGVAFACNAHVGAVAGAREPSYLDPGQSKSFERLLDCTMPLPGRYEVRVWAHPGDRDDGGGDRRALGSPVGSAVVDVVATGPNVPRPLPAHPGLYAWMAGAPTASPMPAEDWARGGYRVLVGMVDGGPRAVPVRRARVTLSVFKEGSPLPCTGSDEPLDEPALLAPGAVHLVRVPVTCAPSEEGRYRIVGQLVLDDDPGVEIGRVGLLVTGNPYFLTVPGWPERPLPPP